MTYSKNSIWIDLNYKNFYLDSKTSGIYVYYDRTLDDSTLKQIKGVIAWLKKNYFFPIRCNIFMENEKRFNSSKGNYYCQGIFFAAGDLTRTKLPRIYIACDTDFEYLVFTLAHELTHYFQWFFFQDEKRAGKSLEIEANKYAKWLTYSYFEEMHNN